jgi:hypothetical protein
MARIQGMLDTIQENIEALAGEATGQAVMQGREALKDSSKPEKVAAWMQGAMRPPGWAGGRRGARRDYDPLRA